MATGECNFQQQQQQQRLRNRSKPREKPFSSSQDKTLCYELSDTYQEEISKGMPFSPNKLVKCLSQCFTSFTHTQNSSFSPAWRWLVKKTLEDSIHFPQALKWCFTVKWLETNAVFNILYKRIIQKQNTLVFSHLQSNKPEHNPVQPTAFRLFPNFELLMEKCLVWHAKTERR